MRVWIAIWVGSSRICTGIAAWLLGGGAWGVFGKLLLAAVVAGVIKGLPWTTNIAYTAAVGWVLTAIVRGLRAPDPAASPAAGLESPAEPPLPTPLELAEALHAIGAPHAHISALAEALDASNEAVREGLREARITISDGVRMKGRPVAVSPGVKRSHFPPLPSPAQDGTLEGVLTSNNNSNNSGGEGPREGMSIIQDEKDPRRWHVRRRART